MAPQLVNGTVADRPRLEVWPGNPVATLWGTMVGKKVVMAATGVVLIGFVIAHMLGNLKIFLGPVAIDSPNAASMLFTAAKVTHLNALPQGQPERDERTLNMVAAMRSEAFGSCSNHGKCEAVCPKGIPLEFIAGLNRDVIRAAFRPRREPLVVHGAPLQPAHDDA
jgi:hypothetical protein